eukprot:TRINITY_DN23840_c0_g2_i4.p2 TRINITY_DN23840_c0_g2~~TRINITY_DN23840_c0_g2_i4.p2  ORF type:complete len:171 (+),score=26.59 TRINITY_DN23840_c0_g2_i4:175-687(+)
MLGSVRCVSAVSRGARLPLPVLLPGIARLLSNKPVGADTSTNRTSPFHDAVEQGNMEEIQTWIQRVRDVNMPDPGRAGATALHIASRRGFVVVVEELHRAGAEIDAAGPWGMTPLQYATVFGHREVARLLVDLGADLSVRDQNGRTALDHALAEQQDDIAQDLSASSLES